MTIILVFLLKSLGASSRVDPAERRPHAARPRSSRRSRRRKAWSSRSRRRRSWSATTRCSTLPEPRVARAAGVDARTSAAARTTSTSCRSPTRFRPRARPTRLLRQAKGLDPSSSEAIIIADTTTPVPPADRGALHPRPERVRQVPPDGDPVQGTARQIAAALGATPTRGGQCGVSGSTRRLRDRAFSARARNYRRDRSLCRSYPELTEPFALGHGEIQSVRGTPSPAGSDFENPNYRPPPLPSVATEIVALAGTRGSTKATRSCADCFTISASPRFFLPSPTAAAQNLRSPSYGRSSTRFMSRPPNW